MTHIQFGTYTPPEAEETGSIDITLGIFFDGTLNNKNNVNERRANTEVFQKQGKDSDKDTSYYGDWSNVARLWDCYDKDNSIYVEGIGTEDKKSDTMMGYAFGGGVTGIRGKVRKACEKITEKIVNILGEEDADMVSVLTFDVFGFSRGAAAARNFVYEVGKSKYKADIYVPPSQGGYVSPILTDNDGYATDLEELPARGHLGIHLQKAGIMVNRIEIRFLGIFDTVSSYSKNFSLFPNFSNDIAELHLDNIARARRIVHFIAENEHRKNFALTNVHTGIEKTFPGVHSDIGGGYENGTEIVEEIETTWTFRSNLDPLKERLISEGWYKEDQLEYTGGNFYFALQGTRYLRKTYSYIPLHFMAEYGVNNRLPFELAKMVDKTYSISNDALLVRVKERLKPYIMDDGKPYRFREYTAIHEEYKGAKISEQRYADYQKEINELHDLRKLRNEYLHWSATREGIVGMDPTHDRQRVVY